MLYLGTVSPFADDVKKLSAVCKAHPWAKPHEALWLAAYQNYVLSKGNPWKITTTAFSDDVGEKQFALYDSTKNGGPLKRLRQKKVSCCPVCGSGTIGHLDHYLPRAKYPHFAILRQNLVPACGHCNSSSKGDTVKGTGSERFIHPYYDKWATGTLWKVQLEPPYEAVTFQPMPLRGLSPEQTAIVKFHLSNVLGEQFHSSLEREWGALRYELGLRFQSRPELPEFIAELRIKYKTARFGTRRNSWNAALYRGILGDKKVMMFLHERLAKPVSVFMSRARPQSGE